MKENYILFSSGRGPEECCSACQKVFERFMKTTNIDSAIVSLEESECGYRSILIKTKENVDTIRKDWEGTIKYISQKNSIRPHHKRSNWFVRCSFMEFDDSSINIDEKDLKIERMRGHGPGGQLRNKVESCVRVTHIPTGMTAISQVDRVQSRNLENAIRILKLKMSILQNQEIESQKREIWLNQIQIERGNEVLTLKGDV